MPSSAIVPSTETRTSTIGATAMNASAGWRTVAQKKMARTPMATATVVLIACVCRPVISSVTVIEMMLNDVAVTASSVAGPELVDLLLDRLGRRGIVRVGRELEQYCVATRRIVDQTVRNGGIPRLELVEELLHQLRIEFQPADASRKSAASFGVVLVAGLPAVLGPVAHEQHVRHLDRSRCRLRATLFVLEGGREIMQVQKRAGFRGLGLHEYAGDLR